MLDRSQDPLHRDTGRTLGTPGAPTPPSAIDNQVAYQYHPTDGRLQKVLGLASSSLGSAELAYTYLPNSHLIHTVSGPVYTIANHCEANRGVLASKQNRIGRTVISDYATTNSGFTGNNKGATS